MTTLMIEIPEDVVDVLRVPEGEALIPSLAEALDVCQERGKFRITELLRRQALVSVGEA